jgi:hypothetical protein
MLPALFCLPLVLYTFLPSASFRVGIKPEKLNMLSLYTCTLRGEIMTEPEGHKEAINYLHWSHCGDIIV